MRVPVTREGVVALVIVALIALGLLNRSRTNARSADATCCPTLSARQLSEPLPLDLKLESGTLGNGLHYYVQENAAPTGRAELRLVVNAGSVLETEVQRGLAHAVEHMLFRGTTKFPGRAIDNYLLSVGMRPGQDLNAYTSMDQTVYSITVPTDRPGVLDTAVAILADMAFAATFDTTEARVEAGIVFEEWRSSRDARERFMEQRNELLLRGSKYASRSPIGDTTVLRRFDVNELRRFYNEWYRPDLMGLAIVGDFDAATVKKLVKKHFGAIRAKPNAKPRPVITVPLVNSARAATLTDAEATSTGVSLWFPHAVMRFANVGDYRTWVISELWQDVLTTRLEDVAEAPGSPLLWASVDSYNPVRSLSATVVNASIVEGSAVAAVDLLMGEVARLAQHGPTERELSLRGESFIQDHWRRSEWIRNSDDLADAYVNRYLTDNVVMTTEARYDLTERIVPTITIADVKQFAARALSDSGTMVLVTRPLDHAPIAAASEQLIAQLKVAATRVTKAQTEAGDTVNLIPNPPSPGRIASETMLREIDAFDLTLSNGMRVILKPSDFTNGHVIFRMFGPGGASLAKASDYASAYLADGVVESVGVGSLNGTRLSRLLSSSTLTLSQTVSDDAIGFRGDVAPRDLEQLFQVLHLKFTAARNDSAAFRRYRERTLSETAHRSVDPDAVFEDSADVVATQNDPRALSNTTAFFNGVSLQKSLGFWNDRMANAAGFTLVMAGNFTLPQVRPLLERYLASLPAGAREQPRDNGIRFPSGVVNRAIYVGAGPRAKARIMLSGPINYTLENSEALSTATEVAELALGDILREKMGGTYGVSVNAGVNLLPPNSYRVTIDFEAAPERIDSLAAVALAELRRLSTVGPTNDELEKIRATQTRDLDNTSESNRYWVAELVQHARMSWSLPSIMTHQLRARELTMATLQDACAKFLSPVQHARVTMFPERQTRTRVR